MNAEEEDGDETWEQKYYKADTQLQKFRSQAGKVRELLGKKIQEYEDKVDEANEVKEAIQLKVDKLECSMKDKDEIIRSLKEKITVMRDERARENEVWEERERIMKNWIKTKIYELVSELEKAKEEKDEFERKLLIENERSLEQKRDEENDGLYEEIFEQMLGDLKKPKYESIWEHSRPTTPVTPLFQRKPNDILDSEMSKRPPAVPPRSAAKATKSSSDLSPRNRLSPPLQSVVSKPFLGAKLRDSDVLEISVNPGSPKPEKNRNSRFLERHLSDITSPDKSPPSPPILPNRKISRPSLASPTPMSKKPHPSRKVSRPMLFPSESEEPISVADDVFFEEHKINRGTKELNGESNTNGEDGLSQTKRTSEPFYFCLNPETYCGIEYESENKTPVYATLRGVASLIRESPFSGESTDSEAEMVENDPPKPQQSSGFTSYISNTMSTDSSRESDLYNTPYDAIEGFQLPKPNGLIPPKPSGPAPKPSGPAPKPSGLAPPKPTANTKESSPAPLMNRNVLKTCAPYTAQNMRTETLEKAGDLIKLGGRVKNWKKRWFVLFDSKLNYYKTRNDINRKPLGQISLETVSSVSRSKTPNTFELCTPKRTYYMTADSEEIFEEWLNVLRNNLKRFAGARLLSRAGERTVHSGWVTKVKGGVSKHCWCVLKEKTLLFYKNETEQNPSSAINLREIINVQAVENSTETLSADDDGRSTLMVQCLKDKHPTYLVIASKREVEEWRFHIVNLNHEQHIPGLETDFENLVTKLMSVDGDFGSRFWQDPLLQHSRALIGHSLSTMSSSDLSLQAARLFKSITLYSTTPISEQAIDYHISLAQDTLQCCFTHKELQTEIYCQLIKQTTKLRQRHGMNSIQNFMTKRSDWIVDDPGDQTIDLNPVPDFVYTQCWQLLALCTSLFLPKLKILWLLKAHLKKNSSPSTDFGRYALYCIRSLEKTYQAGDREARPSRPEVLSMVLRNPYYLPFPMSIPVYFINNTYQVFSFDGSTTVAEFCERINMETGIRDCTESGYALFSDNPIASVEHCLQAELKVCDVISKWEQAMKCLKQGKVERQRTIKLIYKNRLYFKSLAKMETSKERLLLVYQVNDSILSGHVQPEPETSYQLAALLAQIEYGGYSDNFKSLNDVVERFVPDYHKAQLRGADMGGIKRKMYKNIADSWSNLESTEMNECVTNYLGIVRGIHLLGAKLFEAKERIFSGKKEEQKLVVIAVEEEKLTILDITTRAPLCTYSYTKVVTFGGYQDDFMLVINEKDSNGAERTGRHLFAMSKGKVLEITFLIASYINAVVSRRGLNLELRKDKPRSASNLLGRSSITQLWDMESFG